MTTVADGFPPASFDGIPYPIEAQRIRGGLRYHIHEFPHAAGGAAEKLGRSVYRVSHSANFQNKFRKYPKLYPYALDRLRVAFESEKTATLVVPGLGPVQAFCVAWDRDFVARLRSGERASFEYVEDQSRDFVVEAITDLSPRTLDAHAANVARELALVQADLARRDARGNQGVLKQLQSTFNKIQDAVNRVAAIADQVGMYGNLLEAELRRVANICSTFDRIDALRRPIYVRLLDALHDLWRASLGRIADLQSRRGKLQTFTVPVMMPIQQASVAIFGDATHTQDLLSLNAVEDAYHLTAGTTLRYYPENT
ncbi:DNA circularization N-terminal domain-containing protein [Pendulispora brunnea]|uniref:DNA circularization N-terminal domain-containing protein n=1 Tax=Pendulispora brunnea TaxID=2905690 RepID=A0ABZ2KIM0_9BACT